MGLTLNEYTCNQEGDQFYVLEGKEPLICPVCGTVDFEYSNDVITY